LAWTILGAGLVPGRTASHHHHSLTVSPTGAQECSKPGTTEPGYLRTRDIKPGSLVHLAAGDGHIHACRASRHDALVKVPVVDAGPNDDGVVGSCQMDRMKNASERSVKAATVLSGAATLRTHVPKHGAPTTRARPATVVTLTQLRSSNPCQPTDFKTDCLRSSLSGNL